MTIHATPYQEERPWGRFRRFCKNTEATVKIITVKPNEAFSLQLHTKREEFWRVMSGSGVAVIGDTQRDVKVGDELTIPFKTKHRLMARSDGLEILEIGYGDFDEKDIIRYEDKYGRK